MTEFKQNPSRLTIGINPAPPAGPESIIVQFIKAHPKTEDRMTEKNSHTLEHAEAAVRTWRERVSQIQAQIDNARRVLDGSEHRRAQHAMDAALGDAGAASAIKQIRNEHHAAEAQLADLQLALPAAQKQLETAERSVAEAHRSVERVHAEKVMRRRIAEAAEVDRLLAELAKALDTFDATGKELGTFAVVTSGGMARFELAVGTNRILAALPPRVAKMVPGTQPASRTALAASETALWGLPNHAVSLASA